MFTDTLYTAFKITGVDISYVAKQKHSDLPFLIQVSEVKRLRNLLKKKQSVEIDQPAKI